MSNMAEDTPLAGKVAYVTGAARGQGRSHCVRLARSGADVIAVDACGPVAEHNGYPPAEPADLAETVNLVEGEGRKIRAEEVDIGAGCGRFRHNSGMTSSTSTSPACGTPSRRWCRR